MQKFSTITDSSKSLMHQASLQSHSARIALACFCLPCFCCPSLPESLWVHIKVLPVPSRLEHGQLKWKTKRHGYCYAKQSL